MWMGGGGEGGTGAPSRYRVALPSVIAAVHTSASSWHNCPGVEGPAERAGAW